MDFLTVKTVAEAREIIKRRFMRDWPVERVTLDEALMRVAAEDIRAAEDIPAFNRSTVDGYAVMAVNTFGASESVPCFLDIIGSIAMGERNDSVLSGGEAMEVPTGGMLPENADSVVMVEFCEKLGESTLAVNAPVAPGGGVIRKGDDAAAGAVILKEGGLINEMALGALAAAGISELMVYAPLRVKVISTGDEIIEVSGKMEIGKIRDVNGVCLSALLKTGGALITSREIVIDDFEKIKNAIDSGVNEADLVILSGGSSVGVKDYTLGAVAELGEVIINGLSVKPGKPTIVGDVRGKPVFGLPGHPVSAVLVYKQLVDYFLNLRTHGEAKAVTVRAWLKGNLHSDPGKLTCQPVRLVREGSGDFLAEPVYGKSGLITMLLRADGYIEIPENSEGLNSGDAVDVVLF